MGSLPSGGLCPVGVSVQGGLCPWGVSLSEEDLCPQGSLSGGLPRGVGLCLGDSVQQVSVWGSLSRESLSRGVSVREIPCTVTCGHTVCILLECILVVVVF